MIPIRERVDLLPAGDRHGPAQEDAGTSDTDQLNEVRSSVSDFVFSLLLGLGPGAVFAILAVGVVIAYRNADDDDRPGIDN